MSSKFIEALTFLLTLVILFGVIQILRNALRTPGSWHDRLILILGAIAGGAIGYFFYQLLRHPYEDIIGPPIMMIMILVGAATLSYVDVRFLRPSPTKGPQTALLQWLSRGMILKSLVSEMKPPPEFQNKIFISYRRTDSADVTGRIHDQLSQRFKNELIFKDVDSVPLGVDFRKYVEDVIGGCKVVLVVIGPQWADMRGEDGELRLNNPRDHVRVEIESALHRSIPVIPLLVRGATVPSENMLPASLSALSYRNGISIRPDPDFKSDMARLMGSVSQILR